MTVHLIWVVTKSHRQLDCEITLGFGSFSAVTTCFVLTVVARSLCVFLYRQYETDQSHHKKI